MTRPSTPPAARHWPHVALAVIFILLLWLPTLDTAFKLDHSRPAGENRLPAPFPARPPARLAATQKFITGLEAYYNDHFGFRNKLIRWFQNWKIGLYHDRSVYNVIVGRDQWLFTSELQMVDHFLGRTRFAPAQLESWRTLLERRRDWLAARGIQYLFVIPPDKQTVYPEELPAWLVAAAPTRRQSQLDQFLEYMQANSTVRILDLRQPLLAAKSIAPTYLQTDTHWNLYGGWVACQALVKTVAAQFPKLPPLRAEDFRWTNRPAAGGDLARMMGSDVGETNYFEFVPGPHLPVLSFRDAADLVSVWDAHKHGRIVENPSSGRVTAVIFHDSFGFAWQPFLGYCFKKVTFLPENREFNPTIILASKPDIVINEMLERYFNTQSPDELLARERLP